MEKLARETFSLWDEKRVGFSWRTYYLAHTLRVRNLCLHMGRREGGDLRVLEVAALLHDITKRYDGQILVDEHGKRTVDAWGFWKNQCILPNPHRSNLATKLYHYFDQYGELHSRSGALIARAVLELRGVERSRARRIAEAILAHVKPAEIESHPWRTLYSRPECCVLCDADMIDSNLGLVAFYRNVQIYTHRRATETHVPHIREYVQSVPRWLQMKDHFLPRLHTDSAEQIGHARLRRCLEFHQRMICELADDFELARKFGLLAVFEYFMTTHEDPDLEAELRYLAGHWLPRRERELQGLPPEERMVGERCLNSAKEFCALLHKEVEGEI